MKNAALLQKWIHLVPEAVLVICILIFVAKMCIGNVLNYFVPRIPFSFILTYNELDHSLPACLSLRGWKTDRASYLDRLSFSSESF
jgi:hypothetical protein